MTNLDKAREIISMLAIAVGLRDYDEYKEALKLSEKYRMERCWDDLPSKYHDEYKKLIDKAHKVF